MNKVNMTQLNLTIGSLVNESLIVGCKNDGTVYIPLKELCESLGVDWKGQQKRINSYG